MRILIPEFDSKKELFAYLIANKSQLIATKKSMPITADPVLFGYSHVKDDDHVEIKSNKPVTEDVDVLTVRTVANTANWLDQHMDVLIPDSAKKSIRERKKMIPHLHDHIHQVGAKLGEVNNITLEELTFKELGIKGNGSAQAIVFNTDIIKSYNEKVFNQYKLGRINQHSIGLQYLNLDLAINDPESEKEFETWEKYREQIINPEKADKKGFFWAVKEIKLIENSAVLFGSNEITPTLDNNIKNGPDLSTQKRPEKSTKKSKLIHNLH